MPRKSVALVTYHELPDLAADDRLLIPALAEHGGFLLVELELLEPSLFMGLQPGAPERVIEAVRGPP